MVGNFVGRQELLDRILPVNLGLSRRGRLFVVQGSPGSGKTELLKQLRLAVENHERSPAGKVILIPCEQYRAPSGWPGARPVDDAAEFQQVNAFFRHALALTDDEPIDGERIADENADDPLDWETPEAGVSGTPSKVSSIASSADRLTTKAAETVSRLARDAAGRGERVLMLVDNFDLLARPLADWLFRFLDEVSGADVVVTTMPADDERARLWPSRAIARELRGLSRNDVRQYLAADDDIGQQVAENVVEPVWEFTGGNPQVMVLVADLIRETILNTGGPDDAVEAIRQVGELGGERDDTLNELVKRIFSAIGDSNLQYALYSLCVTRRFDEDLLMELLPDIDREAADRLIKRMGMFSFVAKDDGFFTITPFIRYIGERQIADEPRCNKVHEIAAKYFLDRVSVEMGDYKGWRGVWRLLEDEKVQCLKKEWLYHVSRLTGSGRRTGRIGIARLFLDGFWWWGCYVPFPFCEQILAEWMGAVTANRENGQVNSRRSEKDEEDDRRWAQALRTIYDLYPPGERLDLADKAVLVTIREELRLLRKQVGFEPRDDFENPRHVRGIIDDILADILRAINPADPSVDVALDNAKKALGGEEDEYFSDWINFQRSDLCLQREQWQEAMDLARDSARVHVEHAGEDDEPDDELIANFHRVYADALWGTGKRALALDGYARAVLHAYAAQVQDVESPDPYTNAFQLDMIGRCMLLLTELCAAAGDDDAALAVLTSACARIRAFFGDYWEKVRQDAAADVAAAVIRHLSGGAYLEAAALLFPELAPELVIDLDRETWKRNCTDVIGEMSAELQALPGTPLPELP